MLTPSQFPNTYPDDTAKLAASSSRRFSRPDDRKHRKRSKICRIRTAIYKTCLPTPSAPSCLRLSPDEEGGPLPLASGGPPGPPEAAPASDLGPPTPFKAPDANASFFMCRCQSFFDLVKISSVWPDFQQTRQQPRAARDPRGPNAPEAPAPQPKEQGGPHRTRTPRWSRSGHWG